MRKLFGTDGIRGKANLYPMTGEMAMALGRAVTFYFQQKQNAQQSFKKRRPIIVIGKDTRLSCYMLELALASGVCSQGGKAILTGPLPTAGVAFATRSMRADAGVMISASHNEFSDNGIKIFDANGNKLPDSIELELEQLILDQSQLTTPVDQYLGSAKRLDEVMGRYIVQTKNAFHPQYALKGIRLVVDCAQGAGYKVAPMIFDELGAEVVPLAVAPNGTNINDGCGALYPEHCAQQVLTYRADLGICLDGDADRLVAVSEKGEVIAGDQILMLLAKYLQETDQLKGSKEIIGTVMTNMAVEQYLSARGLNLTRAKVGDRYISEIMSQGSALFGGEPSGHYIFKEHSTTGDGIIAALKVLEAMQYYQKPLSELVAPYPLYPQKIVNVAVAQRIPLEELSGVSEALKQAEKTLGQQGRMLLRYSGTEPLIRVMVEAESVALMEEVTAQLVQAIKKAF